MKTLRDVRDYFLAEQNTLVDPDGFDMAYYQGVFHVLDACGDGGISEQYISGIKRALENLTDEMIEECPPLGWNKDE